MTTYKNPQRLSAFLLAILFASVSGCARHSVQALPTPVVVPETPATQFQSSLGRIALAVRVDLPELRFMYYVRDPDRAASASHRNGLGASGCSGIDIGGCLLLNVVAGGIAYAIETGAANRKSAVVRDSEKTVAPALETFNLQATLREQITKAAEADGVWLLIAPQVDEVDQEGDPDYRALAAKGVDTVLEVTLQQVFLEPNLNYSGKIDLDPVLPLDMQTRVRLLKTGDNSILFSGGYSYHGKRHRYTEWAANSADKLVSGINKGYESLGRDISDRVFLLYPFADRLGRGESGNCGLAALGPKNNVADDLAPLLSWQRFPRESDIKVSPEDMKRVKSVRYDLIVASGDNGETPDVFYRRDGLTDTSHRLPMSLSPNTRYFWSVRARFDLDGRMRATDWATSCPFGQQLIVGSRIYRFYTPKVGSAKVASTSSSPTSAAEPKTGGSFWGQFAVKSPYGE